MNRFFQLLQSLLLAFAFSVAALAAAADAPVDVNSADAKTIAQSLKGVGQSKADAIVAYREEHGPFKTADDLLAVKGIGKKTLEANRELIRVAPAAAPAAATPSGAPVEPAKDR